MRKTKHEKRQDLILIFGGLIIVIICIVMVSFLLYQSNVNKQPISEYAIAFYGSISTLILGYLFGKGATG
jgi:uncharacterized protein YpmB